MALVLESPAFRDGGEIPLKYARTGDNVSPPLIWRGAPRGTRSYLLFVEDPDAPSRTFRHWGVCGIDAGRDSLPENAGRSADLKQVANDFGNRSYDGPQPPKDHGAHHYHFRLQALDTDALAPAPGDRIVDVVKAARPHVLDETELVATFETR